jgi:hypothetical protein
MPGAEPRLADPVKLAISMACVCASIVPRLFRIEFPYGGELNPVRPRFVRRVCQVD